MLTAAYKRNTIKIRISLKRIQKRNVPKTNSISASVYKKKIFTKKVLYWPLLRGYFGSWGRTLVAVAVVERFKQLLMYGLSAGTKKSGRCREMAVSGGSTVIKLDFFRNVANHFPSETGGDVEVSCTHCHRG